MSSCMKQKENFLAEICSPVKSYIYIHYYHRINSTHLNMAATTTEHPSKGVWELSMYELQRTPHEAIVDSTEIAVSPRSLHSELMCPICLDLLKKTMTTKECLHRFCSDCIITALSKGNKVSFS